MKNNFLILAYFLFFVVGCNKRELTLSEIVTEYYTAFNSSDYNGMRKQLADSLTMVDGEYTPSYSQESYYEQFKWDSIFQTTYKIVEINEQDKQVIATVTSSSLRFKFLKNDPLTCVYKISFESGKISRIEAIDYIGANWKVWQMKVDSLVSWISTNNPELDGFIHDLSMDGATNYLKAIKLYENSKIPL